MSKEQLQQTRNEQKSGGCPKSASRALVTIVFLGIDDNGRIPRRELLSAVPQHRVVLVPLQTLYEPFLHPALHLPPLRLVHLVFGNAVVQYSGASAPRVYPGRVVRAPQ